MKYSKNALIIYRKQNKLTQGEMAQLVGVSRQTYNYWEKGISVPRKEYADKLAEVCNTTPEVLLGQDSITDTKINFFADACREVSRRVATSTLSYRQEQRILKWAKNIVSLIEADLEAKNSQDTLRAVQTFAIQEREFIPKDGE